MKVEVFEQAVYDLEKIRVIIFAEKSEIVECYDMERSSTDSATVTDFLRNRIYPYIGNNDAVVLDGNYQRAHGSTKLKSVIASYDK